MKASDKITPEERAYWQNLWYHAIANVPRHRSSERGWTVLGSLLGYKIHDPHGKNSASQHLHSAAMRGYKPRKPQAQRLLKMLASNNGTVIARAILIQRGVNPASFKHWPDESVSVLPPS